MKVKYKEIDLGQTLSITMENVFSNDLEKNRQKNLLHQIILDWEITECKKLMEKIGIKNGNKIIDFGCGYGHYTLPCALALNDTGKVYAIDRYNEPLKWIKKKAKLFNVNNIETVKTEGSLEIGFSDKSIDIVLLYDIIHGEDVKTKESIRFSLYKESHRVLKKNGILSVLNFDSDIKKISPNKDKRIETIYRDINKEIIEAGFKFSHSVNNGVHFDDYHDNKKMNKVLLFSELERGVIYNFTKK